MCCGNKRAQAAGGWSTKRRSTHRSTQRPAPKATSPNRIGSSMVYFRYTGRTGLLVKGGRTGKSYRFAFPGAVLPVDPGDRRSLLTVPQLVQVRSGV